MKYIIFARVLGVATVATVLACCASNPVPNEKIAVAKSSVQRAEQAGAPESAPVEMAAARDELARAQKAAADRDAVSAMRLAERANVDAQLAEATARGQRSLKAATEFDASLQALRQESLRSSQPNPKGSFAMNVKILMKISFTLALGACASIPQPNAALERARAAIQRAGSRSERQQVCRTRFSCGQG